MATFLLGFIVAFLLCMLLKRSPKPTDNRAAFLHAAIADLQKKLAEAPDTSAQSLLDQYKQELARMQPWLAPELASQSQTAGSYATATGPSLYQHTAVAAVAEPPAPPFDFANWYADNSINLFLYIGAFLIVASVGTFVGFNWEQLTGMTKALMLIGMTIAFGGVGFLLYQFAAKLKPAGVTFLTIAAILIPFNGVAWYKFVASPQGGTYGTIWLITSLIAIAFYSFLYVYLKKEFFSYIVSISTLSLIESFVRIGNLQTDYYIFGAIITSYILLGFHLAQKHYAPKANTVGFFYSSQVYLPVALALGLAKLYTDGNVFTTEATIALIFATGYYLISHWYEKHDEYFLGARISFLLWTLFAAHTLSLSNTLLVYFVLIANLLVDGLTYWNFTKYEPNKQLKELALFLGYGIPLCLFVSVGFMQYSGSWGINAIHLFILCMVLVAESYLYFMLLKKPAFLYALNGFVLIAAAIYYFAVLSLHTVLPFGVTAFGLGVANYCMLEWQLFTTKRPLSTDLVSVDAIFTLCSMLASLLGMGIVFSHVNIQALFGFLIACLLLRIGWLSKLPGAIIFVTALLFFIVFRLLFHYHVDSSLFPLIAVAVASLPYFAGITVFTQPELKRWRQIFVQTTFLFLLCSNGYFFMQYMDGVMLQQAITIALVAAYFSAFVFIMEAYLSRKADYVYFAIAAILAVYYWQMYVLGFRELQVYLIPTGLALFGIGQYLRLRNEQDNANVLNIFALATLFGPLFFQALGNDGAKYALLLGVEGVVVVLAGTSQRYKFLTYSGTGAITLAVLSQTYSYIAAVPRWAITLVVGIIFLAIAIFLLQHREEKQ